MISNESSCLNVKDKFKKKTRISLTELIDLEKKKRDELEKLIV